MKVHSFVFTIALLVSLLTACNGSSEPEALPVIRYVNFKVYDPVYVAIDKGFFEKHGVKVEMIGDVLAGPTAIQAVASGSCEAGLSSVPALINANTAGLPVQGVIDIQTTLPGQALQRWYVREDSDIQTLEDVPGHVYAVNLWRSSFHYTSLLALDQRDIDEDSVTWVLLSFSDQIPALIEGSVDVVGLMQPYQNYLEMEYGDQVRELFNDYDDVYGQRHVSLIFVNRVWAENNPQEAAAFTHGLADAIDWIEAHQDEAKAIIAKYTGIPKEAVPEYHFTPRGLINLEDVADWLGYLRERGDVTADWVTPEMVATNSYNPFAE
jgi:ABC-type nitrate/sulfonate/bicarbonate transport system substrate-binding protein